MDAMLPPAAPAPGEMKLGASAGGPWSSQAMAGPLAGYLGPGQVIADAMSAQGNPMTKNWVNPKVPKSRTQVAKGLFVEKAL